MRSTEPRPRPLHDLVQHPAWAPPARPTTLPRSSHSSSPRQPAISPAPTTSSTEGYCPPCNPATPAALAILAELARRHDVSDTVAVGDDGHRLTGPRPRYRRPSINPRQLLSRTVSIFAGRSSAA